MTTTSIATATAAVAVPARPVTLSGPITVPNRSTRPAAALDATPSRADWAAISAAESLTHTLLRHEWPTTLEKQQELLVAVSDPIFTAFATRKLGRRGPLFAQAAALSYMTYRQPTWLEFLDIDAVATIAGTDLDEGPGNELGNNRLTFRPRLVWANPEDYRNGVLVDRFHNVTRRNIIERDQWTRGKVATDMRAVSDLLGPANASANLGVRVISHLAPNAGIHFLPARLHDVGTDESNVTVIGEHHRLGACEACRSDIVLPRESWVDDDWETGDCAAPYIDLAGRRR